MSCPALRPKPGWVPEPVRPCPLVDPGRECPRSEPLRSCPVVDPLTVDKAEALLECLFFGRLVSTLVLGLSVSFGKLEFINDPLAPSISILPAPIQGELDDEDGARGPIQGEDVTPGPIQGLGRSLSLELSSSFGAVKGDTSDRLTSPGSDKVDVLAANANDSRVRSDDVCGYARSRGEDLG